MKHFRVYSSPHFGRGGARASGFTLLELLTAIAITAVLVGFSVAIVSNVSGLWRRASGRGATEAQARHILDRLELDLSGALVRDDGRTWLAATTLRTTTCSGLWDSADQAGERAKPESAGGQFSYDVTAANLADTRGGVAGVWLRFFTTARGANDEARPWSVSAPVAVGYQIIRRTLASGTGEGASRRYLLHRAQVRPAASADGPGVFGTGYDLSAYDHLRTPSRDEVIGDNVIDFGVRFYVREISSDGRTGLRAIFPANALGALDGDDLEHAGGSDLSGERMPEVVDVMVRILSEEGGSVLAGYEATSPRIFAPAGVSAAQHWWNLAVANSRVYTRRIVVRAAGP